MARRGVRRTRWRRVAMAFGSEHVRIIRRLLGDHVTRRQASSVEREEQRTGSEVIFFT